MGEIMGISDYIFAIIIPTDIISILPMGRNWCDPVIPHLLPPPAVAVRQASWRSRYVGSSPPSCARPMPAAPPPRWTSLGFHGFWWDSRRFNRVLSGIELDLMGFYEGFNGVLWDSRGSNRILWDLMRLDFFIWLFWDFLGFSRVLLCFSGIEWDVPGTS